MEVAKLKKKTKNLYAYGYVSTHGSPLVRILGIQLQYALSLHFNFSVLPMSTRSSVNIHKWFG